MQTFWKWILGILIALVVIAALVGFGFWVYSRWTGNVWMAAPWRGAPQVPPKDWDDFRDWGRRMPMFPYHMPYMMAPNNRLGWIFPVGLILGGLFQLGLLALIVIGVVALVRAVFPPRPAAGAAAPPPSPAIAEPLPACPKCGYAIQPGWKHCPNCGSALTT